MTLPAIDTVSIVYVEKVDGRKKVSNKRSQKNWQYEERGKILGLKGQCLTRGCRIATRFLLEFTDDISEVCDPPKESSRLVSPLLHLSCRNVDVEWISHLLQISLHEVDTLFDLVVFLNVPSVLLSLLMEDHQSLPVSGVRVEILLPGEEEVGVPEDTHHSVNTPPGHSLNTYPAMAVP